MLELTVAALVVSIITCGIHYKQHFKAQYCRKIGNRSRSVSNSTSIPNCLTHSLCFEEIFHLTTASNEKLDFFPLSCMYYLIFTILLTILIVAIEIMYAFIYNINYAKTHLFLFTVRTNSIYYVDNAVTSLSKPTLIHVFDYVTIYGVMILSIWESLHSFYRYYTTYSSVFKLEICQPKHVLKLFSIYAILYILSYIITIHYFYLAFPIPITFHCVFNLYCNLTFTRVLFQRYKSFKNDKNKKNHKSNKILNSVRHMQITSISCCILQTIYLGVFLATYNVIIILFLPILWCLCAILFCSEFIRNRQIMGHFIAVMCKRCPSLCKKRHTPNMKANNASTESEHPLSMWTKNGFSIQTMGLSIPNIGPKIRTPYSKSVPINNTNFYERYSFVTNTAPVNSTNTAFEEKYSFAADTHAQRIESFADSINQRYSKETKISESNLGLNVPMVRLEDNESNNKIAFEANRMRQAMCTLNTWTSHGFCDRVNYDEMKTINTPSSVDTESLPAFPKMPMSMKN